MSLRGARSISALAVLISFIFLALGIISLTFRVEWHMALMTSGLLTFASGVNISFLAALGRRASWTFILHFLALTLLPLLMADRAVALLSFSLTGLIATLSIRRLDFYTGVIAYSYLAPALSIIYRGVPFYLWLSWGFSAPLIYSVSLHSLPKTYRYKDLRPLAYLSLAFHLLAMISALNLMASISMALYLMALRMGKALSSLKRVRGEALKAHRYLIQAYLLLIPVVLASFLIRDTLQFLHLFLLGFVGLHVYGHSPMMLPVIFGVRNRRSFFSLPLIMLVIASLVWPLNREVSLYFLVGSVPLLASIVLME